MIYVLFGADEFSSAEVVRGLRRRMEDTDPAADLNTNDIDGRTATVGEVQAAADAMPFLSERRLVIVSGLLARCSPQAKGGKALAEALLGYLAHVPASTRLVFHDGRLSEKNPVRSWAERAPRPANADDEAGVVVRHFAAPKAGMLPGWLSKRAAASGGSIETPAAIALADALTRDGQVDLRHAASELEKLLTYAGDRPVTVDDIEELVTPVSLESIFRFTDALAARDGPAATSMLHRFLQEGEHPLRLMALVTRQFRLITRARLLRDAGASERDVAAALPVAPFVARKVLRQARSYDARTLAAVLHRLAAAETDIKTGRQDAVLAVDLFVSELCHSGPHAASGGRRVR